MKTTRFVFILFLLAYSPILITAQQTVYYQSVSQKIQEAKELYLARNYVSAINQFDQIASSSGENSDVRAEAMFYKALCGLKLDNGNAEEQIAEFLKEFPESSFRNRALFEQAIYQFDKKKYPAVLKTLESIDKSEISKDELAHFYYMKGYANFEKEKFDAALTAFSEIKDGNSLYAAPSQYYFGHIHYLKGNYETALQEFLKLKKNPVFEKVIPFYISQIYYKQAKYREVVDYTAPLINKVPADQQLELARLLGDSYFHLREFKNAIQFLEFYLSDKNNKGREENYMLGYCYYLNSQEAKAIPYLEIACKGKDELAQNAYYHLADCYVTTNDKNKARQAFEAASELDFDPKIKEDALFNYAKITYELSYSPFNETIKAFDKYITSYPNAERNDVAYDYLVKVYMSTSNYRDAMASIENIKVKNQSVKKAYQRVAYYRALECFNNLDYNGALENFNKSIDAGDFNKNYHSLALFWKAEALFRLNDFNKAITGYNAFMKSPGAIVLPEYKTAHYNLAYAYFQVKDYSAASDYFRKYLNLEDDLRSEKVADANNRLGDCNFLNRDYSQAISNYDKALRLNVYDADYSLYQKAFCLGLQRDNQGKINALNSLIQIYPNSSYQDDALFELGRTYERINQPQMATTYYKQLITKYPQSNLQNKALVQLGLVSYNANDFKGAVNYYKQVVDQSPNSPETQSALAGMKNSYVEMNDVDSYFAYTNKLGNGVQVSVNEQDSLSYQAAEKLYMAGDKKARAQFERYLNQFPNGGFVLNSHFYLAQLLYADGEFDKALAEYEMVIAQPDNYFTEGALSKAAGLHYNDQNYVQALAYFERLAKISNSGNNLPDALTGIMRCQFNLAKYPDCITTANQILALEKVSDILKRETNYKLGLSYYNSGNADKAFPILSKLSTDTNSAEGAESKFLVAEILFEKQKLKESEKEIMDFIDKNSPHQFWLAKSFLLLSDIYLKNGDEFQAKHTLKSIEENYPEKEDGILEATRQKLQVIEADEASQTKNQSKPLEINISGGKK
ncbi:TPR-domain containing protein [Aquipluma nitroreducens]|uniref:TPR-domain containing protein n=1 Tax=Aquipluma nitroreducens TaxID=2010828 RepID=A0A5K7S6C7_9BACT|nr:tetratricopeptide repeat protein [Aquipluma nitroreducens]BBE17079.1 TPR-domain containing protein [Aquipluma nitroreducens]